MSGVQLRDVTEDDLPIFFEQQLDPDATYMAAFPARDRNTFTAHWIRILGNPTILKKAILLEGQVAGNIVSFEQSGERDLGYWIGKQYWGKGVATWALREFLGHEKARPLYAHVAKHNIASIRVLEKCGFTICGYDKVLDEEVGKEIGEITLELRASARNPSESRGEGLRHSA